MGGGRREEGEEEGEERRGALSLQNEDPTPQDGWDKQFRRFAHAKEKALPAQPSTRLSERAMQVARSDATLESRAQPGRKGYDLTAFQGRA